MNVISLQITLLFFALFMVYVLFIHWKKKDISNLTFALWSFIWILFIFIDFSPRILEPLLKELFLVRVMDLGMIGAFMVLTYVTFENNVVIKKYEKELEEMVRKIALKGDKK